MKRTFVPIWALTLFLSMLVVSCNKDDYELETETETETGWGETETPEEGQKPVEYYIRFTRLDLADITIDAGRDVILIESNQPWKVISSEGDITEFQLHPPLEGEGDGRVYFSFGEGQWKDTGNTITCRESQTVSFLIREGNTKNYRERIRNVYIGRYGSKVKV